MARTDLAVKGAAGVSAFLVEAGIPGIGIGPKEKKMGQQGAPVADVVFTECRVPAEALLGGVEGQGFRVAMRVLDRGRLAISASFTGFAERILDDMVAYAVQRQQFGRPIAEFQLIQAMIADSKADLVAARAMVLESSRAHDRGEDISLLAACCKMFTSESLGRVADRNVQVHGGAGYVADYAGGAALPGRPPGSPLRRDHPDPAAGDRPQRDPGGQGRPGLSARRPGTKRGGRAEWSDAPRAPQRSPTVGRRLAIWLLRLRGWRLVGRAPDLPKYVVVFGSPHLQLGLGCWGCSRPGAMASGPPGWGRVPSSVGRSPASCAGWEGSRCIATTARASSARWWRLSLPPTRWSWA